MCAAPVGNEFWKLRSKHGRDRIIESPEVMLDAIHEFLELKENTYLDKPEMIKGGEMAGIQVNLKVKDYPTLSELAHFLGFMTLKSWRDYKERDGFLTVITYAEEIISNWKLKGTAIGVYNHNIVARDLGLVDKKEHDHKSKSVESFLSQFEKDVE